MQIMDKYGYLESALDYIEKNVVSGRGLQKIAKKTRINKGLLKNLSLSLKNFSEKQFFTLLQESLEEHHSSLSGAVAEVLATDISVEKDKKGVLVLLNINFDIIMGEEVEDKIALDVKIYSKNNIIIE